MPRFSANLSMLFTELPFLDRFQAAADAGFTAVEFMFPYEFETEDIAARLAANGLRLVLFNLLPGNWAAGDRGLAIYPDKVDAFRASVAQAVRYATALGCRRLHCLAGIAPDHAEPRSLRATYIDNLKFAAEALAEHDLQLLIEPINTRDIPGYFLHSTDVAADIITRVGADNLALQYDVYHMQIMQGDHATHLNALLPLIGHIQVADTPGRHEPGTGEINFPFLFQYLDQIGYRGFIGCEYRPRTNTYDSLTWLRSLRAGPAQHG